MSMTSVFTVDDEAVDSGEGLRGVLREALLLLPASLRLASFSAAS